MLTQPKVCSCLNPGQCMKKLHGFEYSGECQLEQHEGPKVVIATRAEMQPRLMKQARDRVRKVAEGRMINTTYGLPPGESLEAFRSDLLLILGDE